jgi:uncharacterized protein YceK
MRILASLVVLLLLSGCTAMLVGGSATTEKPTECEQGETKDQEREC